MDATLSDIAAIMPKNDDAFGGNSLWIFALLILLMLGGGGLFGQRTGEAYATQADVQRAVDMNSVMQGQGGLAADIQRTTYEQIAATKDAAYNNLSEIRDIQSAVAVGFANSQNCCCETNRNIDSVRFDMANYSSAIQQAIHADGEQTRALINQNKIEALQAQVNQLTMAQQLCGVPKISPYAYNVVPAFPYNPIVQ